MKMKHCPAILILLVVGCSNYYDKPSVDSPESSQVILSDILSHPGISSIIEDRSGHVWIGTDYGLNKDLTYAYRQYYSRPDSVSFHDNHISSLLVDNAGRLWVMTISSGAYYYTETGQFHKVGMNFHGVSRPRLFLGNDGSVLCNTETGIFLYDEKEDEMVEILDIGEQNTSGFVGSDGMLYLLYSDRLDVYDMTSPANPVKVNDIELPNEGMRAVPGPEPYIWLTGSDTPFAYNMLTGKNENLPETLRSFLGKDKIVHLIRVIGEEALYVMNINSSLYIHDAGSGQTEKISDDIYPDNGYIISCLYQDSAKNIWVGTNGGGAILLPQWRDRTGLHRLREYFRNTHVSSINYDPAKNLLYIADNNNNFYSFNPGTGRVENIAENPSSGDRSSSLYDIVNKSHMIALRSGETAVISYDSDMRILKADGTETCRFPADSIKEVLSCRHLVPEALFEDMEGKIWVGSQSKGIAILDRKTQRIFKAQKGSCEEITSISQDDAGHVWVGTSYGLNRYDLDGTVREVYTSGNGIECNAFSSASVCPLPDGTLLFGTMQGIEIIPSIPDELARNACPFVFENLKIKNTSVIPGPDSPIDKELVYKPDINLRFNQNNFSISFATLDYASPSGTSYQYMLEGFNNYWIDAMGYNEAFFSNIPSGDYKFKVRQTNSNGTVYSDADAINIHISPAPWMTWKAKILYSLIFLLLVYYTIRRWRRAQKDRLAIMKARMEKEQEAYLNEINKRYFANVAHQLRTPLTMISGPVEILENSPRIEGGERRLFSLVRHNVGRMLTLVNQIMDFNQLETDALKLKVRIVDITEVVGNMLGIFQINAMEKGISLLAENAGRNIFVYADSEKIENILDNLLSNAIKFTPEGGEIKVRMEEKYDPRGAQVEITVTDTGAGIREEDIERIFERFYQVEGASGDGHGSGNGIGLYYSLRLARLHHGTLKAANRTDGPGSIFTLSIPAEKDAYSVEELISREEAVPQSKVFPNPVPPVPKDENMDDILPRPLLLVVDDDPDITLYLRTLLESKYNVLCKYDVPSSKEVLSRQMPSLIISDVVMNGLSGYDLCSYVKGDIAYCHIPVILLTAKDTMEDKIEGLQCGADAFVTKPFNPEYFLSLIENQLVRQERLRKALTENSRTYGEAEQSLSPQDKKFLQDLYDLMEKEIMNSDLNVSGIVEKLGMSHSKFIYKMKGLTGSTPLEFFNNYKLNRAAQMLREGKFNVSEVADYTGFSSQSHFSKVFKKKFGVAPSQFR